MIRSLHALTVLLGKLDIGAKKFVTPPLTIKPAVMPRPPFTHDATLYGMRPVDCIRWVNEYVRRSFNS